MRRLVALTTLLFAAACGSNKATPTPSAAPAMPEKAVVHAYNVHLDPKAEEGSDAITFIVHARKFPLHVVVRGPDVDICPTPSPEEGKTAPCEHRKVADINAEGAIIRAVGDSVDLDEIDVSYEASDHTARVDLPNIAPRPGESVCKDACNPVLELTPFKAGRLEATATWNGIATGRLLIETGAMSEHSYVELGKPYTEIASKSASSDVRKPKLTVEGTVPATEAGVALENGGARLLLKPTIDVTWP